MSENIDNTSGGTGVYNTQIPSLDDAADIQKAFRLYHYGSSTVPQDENEIVEKSVVGYIKALDTRVDTLESNGAGSDYIDVSPSEFPTGKPDGFIWMDANSSVGDFTSYASAIYSPIEPDTDLTAGLIWVDSSTTPPTSNVYNGSVFEPMTEIPNIIDNAGDLIYGAAPDDIAKLSIGNEDQILKVTSGLPSWSDQKTWVLKNSGNLNSSAFTVSSLNGEKLFIVLHNWSHDNIIEPAMVSINFNSDYGPNYINTGGVSASSSLKSPVFYDSVDHDLTVAVDLANSSSILKPVSTIADNTDGQYFGYYRSSSSINSVTVSIAPSGNFDSGTYEVWSYE